MASPIPILSAQAPEKEAIICCSHSSVSAPPSCPAPSVAHPSCAAESNASTLTPLGSKKGAWRTARRTVRTTLAGGGG